MASSTIEYMDARTSAGISADEEISQGAASFAGTEFEVFLVDVLLQQFTKYAESWRRETAPVSSLSKVVMHPSYHKIIDMGWDVVPLLLEDLNKTHSFWFPALTSITGQNPVDARDAGNVARMTQAWLNWGRQRELI